MAFTINYRLKNTRFYLNFAIKIHIYYNKLLFSIYKEKNSLFIYITDQTKLNILEKNMVILNMLVDNKSKVVNFCNIFYTFKLKYNLLLVGTIEKATYLILSKKRKITIFNNKENIAFKAAKIRSSYLINILISRKFLVLAFLYLVLYNHTL